MSVTLSLYIIRLPPPFNFPYPLLSMMPVTDSAKEASASCFVPEPEYSNTIEPLNVVDCFIANKD